MNRNNDYELAHVTHNIHKSHVVVAICMLAGCPQIDMKDNEWRANRPSKKILSPSPATICENTVGTLRNPVRNIRT